MSTSPSTPSSSTTAPDGGAVLAAPSSAPKSWLAEVADAPWVKIIPLGITAAAAVLWMCSFTRLLAFTSTLHIPLHLPDHSEMVAAATYDLIGPAGISSLCWILLTTMAMFVFTYMAFKKEQPRTTQTTALGTSVAFIVIALITLAGLHGQSLATELRDEIEPCVIHGKTAKGKSCIFAPVAVTAKLRTDKVVTRCGHLVSVGDGEVIVLTPDPWRFPSESFVDSQPIDNPANCTKQSAAPTTAIVATPPLGTSAAPVPNKP